MLGKLMKYDLRSCLRKFGPLWIAALALSMLIGLSFRYVIDGNGGIGDLGVILLGVLPSMILFGLFVAIAVMTLVFICGRFYHGLLGDEGYLMFTLPVSAEAHIASKGLTAVILEIVSCLVALLSGFLLVTIYWPAGYAEGWVDFWHTLGQLELPSGIPWLIVEGILFVLITAALVTLKIYTAIAIGHLAKKHRALWGLLAYIGISIVLNILFSVGASSGLLWKLLSFDPSISGFSVGDVAFAIGMAILLETLLGAGFFFLTRFILKKHLNLY